MAAVTPRPPVRAPPELAVRARELVNEGTSIASACRIIEMEDQLGVARQRITQLENAAAAEPAARGQTRKP